MTFLAPVPALIAAAVTVPALLALYFLKLRRRPVRVGSTMLWRQAAEDLQANVPFRMLRPSLLLFVQLLALALLLLAMARPALDTGGRMPSRVFVLLDRSASMRATDMPGGGTRFEEAVRLANRAVDRLTAGGGRSEITLILYAASADVAAGPTRSRSDIRRALDMAAPSDQPDDLASALRLVQALSLPDDEGEQEPPLVIICSDGGTASGLPALSADLRFERAAPNAAGANLAITALSARRDSEEPGLVRIFARAMSNTAPPAPVPLTLAVDGEVVLRRSLDLTADASADAAGQRAIETPIVLEWRVPGESLLTVTLDIRDALAADNAASLVIGAPIRPAVLLVREAEAESAGAGWLLTDVLREMNLSALTLVSAERVASLGAEVYSGVDVAVFDGVSAPFPPPVPSLHFGNAAGLEGLRTSAGPGRVLPIVSWDRTNPLMRDISLDAVRVGAGELLVPVEDGPRFTELARTAGGVVLALIDDGRTQRVVSGFPLVQSTWPVDYSFPIFLANSIESLSRTGGSARGWSGSTSTPVKAPPALPPDFVLIDPDGADRTTAPVGQGADTPRGLGVLERAGVWRADGVPVPVNLFDARESSIATAVSLPVPGASVDGASPREGFGEPREVWPWFVLAAAGLLCVEWVLFGLRARVS